ncbi:MAG: hypothetical protein HY852_05115 [Bradyrhizobium sp.]|uniref:hypothetical protein n=1 Tax=Bradyrhizobium sp. TaxID=376 RepID=UPI0025C659A8|nr:hypothetical protein [Bradyrhizobium sp.]MBI5261182.1 hypothetical protein [Bradyrhizobium sp.]
MRYTEASGSKVQNSADVLLRALRLGAIALGIGLVMTAGAARAQDDDDSDMTFEEKIIDNLMSGIGARSMEKPGIDYRERSPLVVPPKLDLPPPASAPTQANAPNWPKDPDEARRKAAIAARKKSGGKPTPWEAARPLTPAELNAGRTAAAPTDSKDPIQPGVSTNPMLSAAELGYTGGFMGLFKGNSGESKEFKGEPPRSSLVEPPPGYQTPSPSYAYGTGPDKSGRTYYDIMTGKEKQQ